jgi:hypothetical protein
VPSSQLHSGRVRLMAVIRRVCLALDNRICVILIYVPLRRPREADGLLYNEEKRDEMRRCDDRLVLEWLERLVECLIGALGLLGFSFWISCSYFKYHDTWR